ncbi:hypothetical protein BDQ12DRAFT_642154 [Crucibulum laeve]|uniref:Uncharacterized protein n=1 Tax=Crucibulum laeve TaxID=68775 RepID=A0A5C3MIK6_9AGAR|nr:hypothetical protein BDQ12DRAFT_642154 [Crucibulum laeve]
MGFSVDVYERSSRPVLRNHVDETFPQGEQTPSPRSELLSQSSSRAGRGNISATVESQRRSRHGTSERRRRERELTQSGTSQRDLVKLLVEQERDAAKLRKALYGAFQRLQTESQRVADLERDNREAAERFRLLNVARLTAEQEANKASQQTKLYELQLQNAQSDILRAQETVDAVEKQRDDAEAAAKRARSQAREIQQRRLVDAAREEGRRFGFESGLKQAQEELRLGQQRRNIARVAPAPPAVLTEDTMDRPYAVSGDIVYQRQQNREIQGVLDGGNGDEIESLSSSSSLPLNPPPQPPLDPSPQSPPVDRAAESQQEVPQIQPIIEPTPPPGPSQHFAQAGPDRNTYTPSIQYMRIDVPPHEEIVQTFNTNESYHAQPKSQWVTAQEHGQLNNQHGATAPPQLRIRQQARPGPSVPAGSRRPAPAPQQKRGVKFTPSIIARPSLTKAASSWYRSLSFRKKNKPKPIIDPDEDEAPPPPPEPFAEGEELYEFQPPPSQSWYQNKAPSVRSRDFGHPQPHSRAISVDSRSTRSTRVSEFDLTRDPGGSRAPPIPGGSIFGGSASGRSVKSAGKRLKEKESVLSVINEDPGSRGNTPMSDRYHGVRPRAASDTRSNGSLSQPGFAPGLHVRSSSEQMYPSDRPPPRQFRRPDTLTVPSPLAPLQPHQDPNVRLHANSHETLASGSGQRSRSSLSPVPDSALPHSAGIGITVQPPSASPSDGRRSMGTPTQTSTIHLSPNDAKKALPHSSPRMGPLHPALSNTPQSRNEPLPEQTPSYHPSRASLSAQSINSTRRASPLINSTSLPVQFPSSPQVDTRRTSTPSRPASIQDDLYPARRAPGGFIHSGSPSNTPKPLGSQLPPVSRPESIRSIVSRRSAHGNAGMTPGTFPSTLPPHDKNLNRIASNASLRTTGSYGTYDPTTYVDPALWGPDGPSSLITVQPNRASGVGPRSHSRAASENSALSYITG